jgi:hypothetical protein
VYVGVFLSRIVATALDDRRQPQSGHCANHRRVKSTSRQPETNQPNINHEEPSHQNNPKSIEHFESVAAAFFGLPKLPESPASLTMFYRQ